MKLKKISIALLLCITMLSTTVLAAVFPDMPENHWSYSAVDKMVNDGRVNGFPDGTFKPDELVTRWQFVKMSGGNPDETSNPDRDATRDEAAFILWERAGKPSAIAPGAVTLDSKNPEAVAWAYANGVMKGEDGLNLRLQDTLTRAEAATMIVRAEQELITQHFISTVDPIILERVWMSVQKKLAYEPTATITNGYLARLALQIAYNREDPTYFGMKAQPTFEGEYAKDIQFVAEECLGVENATAEFMNKNASMEDMVAVLSYYAMKQATGSISYSPEKVYADCTVEGVPVMKAMGLRFARHNGIFFTAEDKINAAAEATIKDAACVILQLDEIIGLTKAYGMEHATRYLKTNGYWPDNADDYAFVLSEVPAWTYETPIIDGKRPVDYYEFIRSYGSTFVGFLDKITGTFPKGVKGEWTFYPSLVADGGSESVVRAKLKITANPENLPLNQILTRNTFPEIYFGDEFMVDIATGTLVMDVILDADNYCAVRAFDI